MVTAASQDLCSFVTELRSFGVEIGTVDSLSEHPKLHLIGELRDAKDAGNISASELIVYLQDLGRIPSTSVQEEEELSGMRYYDILNETLRTHLAIKSPQKEYVCERCGSSFEAPSDLVDPFLGEEGYELCDRCLGILFEELP
ncbi:MAG: hypothetical protein WC291_08130 [Thermodesulfovibrionales bacterium]